MRDVIIEVNEAGEAVDDRKLPTTFWTKMSTVIKTLDQGAAPQHWTSTRPAGHMTAEELAKLDASDDFGDRPGTGLGRNGARQPVDYDPTDDSIIAPRATSRAIVRRTRQEA